MFLKRILSGITTLAIFASMMATPSVFALNEITGGSDASGTPNTNISLNWQITGSGTIPVHLYVPTGTLSMTTIDGLTFTGSPTGSSLYFSGSLEDINAALATLRYNVGSNGTYTVELSLVEAGQIVYPATGHVYEVIDHGSAITPTAARAAALARTYGGISGYLANITSAEENAFISGRLTQDGWFGASDITTEGTWQWLDGPEAGTTFWTGLSNGVASGYENWSSNEPNDQDGEDCSEFYADGSGWNDLPCDWGGIDSYVVEYGTTLLGGGPVSDSDSLTVTVSADSTPPVQSDIVLTPSTTSATITLTTDEAATSSISYGPTSSYGTTTTINGSTTTSHSGSITGLSVCGNTYHYQITTTDAFENTSTSTDATFVTHCISGYSAPLEESEETVAIETKESPQESMPTKESEKQPETPTKEENTQKPETKNITLNSATSAPEVSCKAEPYLTKSIKLGSNNNPVDVKLLEKFLNKYENAGLIVDGIYSREDFQAVIKWQEKHASDILKPWGLKKGTGYIYKTSLAKIKEIEESACDKEEQK